MIQNDDEKKYEYVIQKLKNLPKIDAPDYFEADLKRKLSEETPEKKSLWNKLLLPSRLIPSAGLAAAAIILFFVVNINSEEMDNPFLIEPKLREDIIEISNVEGYLDKDEVRTNIESKEKSVDELDAGKKRQDVVGETKSGRDEPTMMLRKESSTDEKLLVETETSPKDSFAELSSVTQPAAVQLEAGGIRAKSDADITKEELNFRQVQLNSQEQQVVNELRNKMQINQQKKTEYQK